MRLLGHLDNKIPNLLILSIGWITYFSFFVARKQQMVVPEIINSYFTDLLCIPLVLGTVQALIRILKNNPHLKLTIPMIGFSVIAFAMAFEWWLPQQKTVYTADPLDVVCYVIGGLVFAILNKTKFR